MKLSSDYFDSKYAMDFNAVNIENDIIRIHSTDLRDMGFICSYRMSEANESMSFMIARKDYLTLSKLGEFELKMKDNRITVTSRLGKIVISNMVDRQINDPETDELIQLKITPKDFVDGKNFVGDSDSMIQLNGANIFAGGICITDKLSMYLHYIDTGLTDKISKINIPKEAFKHLEPDASIATDGRIALFIAPGKMFYTTLVSVAMDDPKIIDKQKAVVSMKLEKAKLLEALNLVRSYSKTAKLKVIDNTLHIIENSELSEMDIEVPLQQFEGNALCIDFAIDKILKVLNMMKGDEIKFSKQAIMIMDEETKTYSMSTCYASDDREVK